MKKIFFASFIMFMTFIDANAQQDPHYTQYMYNMNVMNPAYAGSKENLSFGLLNRRQWVGIEGAPTTYSLSGSMPVGKNVGAGLSIINDKIGPVEETNVYADISYTLNIGEESHLAFGIKGGITMHQIDFETIRPTLPIQNDPTFNSANPNSTKLNIGTGLFYYTDKYYIALSIPNILRTKYLDFNGREYGTEVAHYFLTGGYVFDLNPSLKFKPFAMIKSSLTITPSVDVNANFLFNDKFELGASYRIQDSYGLMANYAITPDIRIGYAYDHIISDLRVSTAASHEVILLFDLNFPKRVSRSSRYF
jgi:type IX secretion system PorP/SprF family membrane protein